MLWSNLSMCLLVAPCACAGRCSLQTTVSRSGESRGKFETKGLFGKRLESRNRVGRVEVQLISAGRRVMMISSLFMLPRPLHRSQPITGHEQMTPPLRELDLQLPIRLFFRLSFDVDQSNILDLYIVTDYFTITITAVHRTVHAHLVMNFRPTTKASTVCSSKTGSVLRHVLFPSPNPETPCFSRQLVKAQPFDSIPNTKSFLPVLSE